MIRWLQEKAASRPLWQIDAVGAATCAALAVLAAAVAWQAPSRDAPGRSVWLSQPSPPDARIVSGGVLSPDGRYLAFVARDEAAGNAALWMRSLESSQLERLAGTDGAGKPFWSPDSRRIGFFANGKLKTIDAAGGAPHTVADVDVVVAGGTWSAEEEAAFKQPVGQVSNPVRTPFGFHLIKVEEADAAKGEIHARHILFGVTPTRADQDRALKQIEEVRTQAAKGVHFGTLARRYSKYKGPAGPDGDLGFVPMTVFSSDFRAALVLHTLGTSVGALQLAVFLGWLGVPFTAWALAAAFSVTVALDLFSFFVPARLGAQEASRMLAMSVAGLDPARGLSFSLVLRAEQIFWAGVGLLVVPALLGARREPAPLAARPADGEHPGRAAERPL